VIPRGDANREQPLIEMRRIDALTMKWETFAGLFRAAVLAVILSVGALLRLFALRRRGLIYWDEAKFALEGIRFAVKLPITPRPTCRR
jgi:hypothetical protein